MDTRRIGELLVAERIIQPQDLEKALQLQSATGGRLGSILFRTGALSEEALLRVLSVQLGAAVLGTDAPMPDESRILQGIVESGIPLDWFIDQRVLLWSAETGLGWTAQDPLNALVLRSTRLKATRTRRTSPHPMWSAPISPCGCICAGLPGSPTVFPRRLRTTPMR